MGQCVLIGGIWDATLLWDLRAMDRRVWRKCLEAVDIAVLEEYVEQCRLERKLREMWCLR